MGDISKIRTPFSRDELQRLKKIHEEDRVTFKEANQAQIDLIALVKPLLTDKTTPVYMAIVDISQKYILWAFDKSKKSGRVYKDMIEKGLNSYKG